MPQVIIELREQADLTTEPVDVKKELGAKKKVVTALTNERDALKAKKLAVASGPEQKDLAKLGVSCDRGQCARGAAAAAD